MPLVNKYKVRVFNEVFHTSKDRLYAFLMEYTDDAHFAEDIMQACYMKVWENMEQWDNTDRLLPLLKTIARNLLLNAIREKAQLPVEWLEKYGVDHIGYTQPDHNHTSHTLHTLDQFINQLPDQCRKVFVLHREHGLSYHEIAERLAISANTVRNHMSKAIQFLKTTLYTDLFQVIFLMALTTY